MRPLPPWTTGPFELLRHAEEHLRAGEDFDRRIPLISFDNSIESSIAVYLSLKPIFRGNRTYRAEDVEKWLRTYYGKLEFFDLALQERELKWVVDKNNVIFCHEHRNEQYHGGNKGTPEKHILDISRTAALWVFSVLFDDSDIEERLGHSIAEKLSITVPERNPDYDNAIDGTYDTVDVAGQTYSVSEILYFVDYEAYRDLGIQLCEAQQNAAEIETQPSTGSLH